MADPVITVLTVWCGQCEAERGRSRGKLGTVERRDDGAQLWRTRDRRKGRNLKAGATSRTAYAVRVLTTPHASHLVVPDRLHVTCELHGTGTLSTDDVLGRRGSVVLNMIAPA